MIYPERIRRLSSLHWTSVKASLRASQLCVFKPGANVLDVGSGVGKFCLIGAIVTDGHFVGVEQREYFVDLATSLAKQLRLNRVEFQLNNIVQIDWSPFDSIYLYNPFYENIEPMIHIDEAVDLDPVLYDYYSKIVTGKLAELKVGTRVVILNGYGGTLPSSYELLSAEKMGRAILEAWVQTDGL
jgi:SAM-dependent methyltransferase